MEDWKTRQDLGFSSFAIIPSSQYSNIPAAKQAFRLAPPFHYSSSQLGLSSFPIIPVFHPSIIPVFQYSGLPAALLQKAKNFFS